MEVELLWPRVWQMACRLEEIPQPNDFVEYEFLDQSVIVLRTDDMGVRAFQNACRHRGVKVVEGRGHVRERVHVPVPRMVLRPRRHEHRRARAARRSPSTTCSPTTSTSSPCAARCGAAARGSTSTPTRRRCASASSRPPPILDALEGRVAADREVVRGRLPVNWKLAIEAFVESTTWWRRIPS